MEPRVARTADPTAVAWHVDRAVHASVRAHEDRGARTPARHPRTGDLCLEPSEPHGRAGHPLVASRPLALPPCARHAEGLFRRTLPSPPVHVAPMVHQFTELLP